MGTVKMLLFKILPFLSLAAADYWPNLRVTFGLNPFGNAFYPYPITESEAIAAGWEKIGTCGDPIWLGERYADPSDPALVLIYDQAGYIAGSQSGMLASNVDESVFPVSSNPIYQAGDFYGVPAFFSTAYFVDTAIICNGVGSRLHAALLMEYAAMAVAATTLVYIGYTIARPWTINIT